MDYNYMELRAKVEHAMSEMANKIQESVPDTGWFPMIYSEFENTDKALCLTDVRLTFEPRPDYLPDYKTHRWLHVVGYKWPVPYKCSMVAFGGRNMDAVEFLRCPENVDEIIRHILQIDFNMLDE